MPSTEKIERVAALKERIQGSTALLLTEYRGLSVSDITELRRSLREGGALFSVIKNTLMRRALEQTDAADLSPLFEGPSAVAFVTDDPVAAAKSVAAAAKRFPTLVLKGGFMEGRVLSADEAKALAELESREVMLSRLAGMMQAEIARAAATFQAAQARFLAVLQAFEAKLPEPPAEPTEPPAAEPRAAATADDSAVEAASPTDVDEPDAPPDEPAGSPEDEGEGAEAPQGKE